MTCLRHNAPLTRTTDSLGNTRLRCRQCDNERSRARYHATKPAPAMRPGEDRSEFASRHYYAVRGLPLP